MSCLYIRFINGSSEKKSAVLSRLCVIFCKKVIKISSHTFAIFKLFDIFQNLLNWNVDTIRISKPMITIFYSAEI